MSNSTLDRNVVARTVPCAYESARAELGPTEELRSTDAVRLRSIFRLGGLLNQGRWHLEQAAFWEKRRHRESLVDVCEDLSPELDRVAPPPIALENRVLQLPHWLREEVKSSSRFSPFAGQTLNVSDVNEIIEDFLSKWRGPVDEDTAGTIYSLLEKLEDDGLQSCVSDLEFFIRPEIRGFQRLVYYPIRLLICSNNRDEAIFDLGHTLDQGIRPLDVWKHCFSERQIEKPLSQNPWNPIAKEPHVSWNEFRAMQMQQSKNWEIAWTPPKEGQIPPHRSLLNSAQALWDRLGLPAVSHLEKWKAGEKNIQEVVGGFETAFRENLDRMRNESEKDEKETILHSVVRLEVRNDDLVLDGQSVALDITTEKKTELLRFLGALTKEWQSGPDIQRREPSLRGIRIDRLLKLLPENARTAVESKTNKGYRLAVVLP